MAAPLKPVDGIVGKKLGKGSRIRITTGPGAGVTGSIFWTGKDKYRGGQRFGVRGDDGGTHWVGEPEVEATDAPEPTFDGPTFEKGDRVSYKQGSDEGTGSVFWIGDSRQGGQRLGVRNDHDPDNAVWIDARFCERLEGEAPAPAPSSKRGGGGGRGKASGDWGADDAFVDNSWEAAAAGMNETVPEPPEDAGAPVVDDGYYDSLAASVSDDDDSPPW